MSNADASESLSTADGGIPANADVVFSLPDEAEDELTLAEEPDASASLSEKPAESRNSTSSAAPTQQEQQPPPPAPPAHLASTSEIQTAAADSVESANKNKDSIVEHSATTASNQTPELANSVEQQLPSVVSKDSAPDSSSTEPAAAASQPPPTKRQRQQQSSRQSSLATVANDASNSAAPPVPPAPNSLLPPPPPQLSARQRAHQRAVKSASAFNRRFLANRPSGAVCTQTLQLLLPVTQPQSPPRQDKSERSAYPVAILPGQFADCCQHADSITAGSERLNYLPLTSCLYALPRRPPLPPVRLDNAVKCTVCQSDCSAWQVIECSECRSRGHAACLQLPDNMLTAARAYAWQCMDCKRCQECLDPGNEERMMFCDACDRGFHTFCLGLQDIPQGHWECPVCVGPSAGVKSAAPAAPADSASNTLSTNPTTAAAASTTAATTTKTKKPRGGGKRKSAAAAAAALELPAAS
ncbi:hypothetical protein BOX15_Mlig024207g2 [Macrostomum lignano]|uniref:PHD-type domain-containing protein n=1 Tax=Macrostomum lignano TaxID=282301 RepID=A0A267G4R9_9PLAT|nr:hypothetical protein BOX15_Mlig024207g2 [Macrostomum lignano]